MNYNWEEINWIFKPDGALRDIYIQDVDLNDWMKIIDYINLNYKIKFGEDSINRIDKDYVIKYLLDQTSEIECKTLKIDFYGINIHCYFFLIEQIEFDILPSEIRTKSDFDNLLIFMNDISLVLEKQITLTGENEVKFPLIKINAKENFQRIITEKEITEYYQKNNSSFKNLYYDIKSTFLMRLFPKLWKNNILKSATEPLKADKLNENIW